MTQPPPNQPPYPPGGYPPGQYGQQPYPPGYYPQQVHVVQPRPGMSAGKVVLIVVGVVGFMVVGSCAVCSMIVGGAANAVAEAEQKREAKAAEAKVQLEKDLEDCKKSEAMEWRSIAASLKQNEAKVASAWKDSCAKVSGVVERVDSGFDDKPYVVISDGSDFSLNNLHCKPKDEKKALNLRVGQTITVWGAGGSEIVGSLVLEHCDW